MARRFFYRAADGRLVLRLLISATGSVSTLAGAAALAQEAPRESLQYTFAPDPVTGRLGVELTWQTHGRTESALSVSPRWGMVDNVPALLGKVTIDGASAVQREGEAWRIAHADGAALRCRYAVQPNTRTLGWESIHVPVTTGDFFHGIGNTFLLVPRTDATVGRDVSLTWKLPAGWRAVCSWGAGDEVRGCIAPDDIRHSVYLAGKIVTRQFEVAGTGGVTVAMLERFAFDPSEFARLTSGIVSEQAAFMEDRAFPPFVVTAVPVGQPRNEGESRLAGTGLYRSFALFIPPRAKINDAAEHLFAHELFHYWNGRVLQAADPQEVVFWFTEGLTDYYALRLLLDAGRWQPETFAKWINRHLREYVHNPARNATNDEIRAGFWSRRETVGQVPYQRGLTLGMRWHFLAQKRGVAGGLDTLFKQLVALGREGALRLSNDAVRAHGVRVLGEWFGEEFDRYVIQAELVEVPPDALVPRLRGKVQPVYAYALGFDRERSLAEGRIIGLLSGSPAEKAGLREGDRLEGWSVFDDPDRKCEFRILRDGRARTVKYFPRGARCEVVQFAPAGEGRANKEAGGD